MRVLLTGATGFVGSFTLPALLRAGHEVVALVRSPAKAQTTMATRGVDPADPAVRMRGGDILDADSIAAALDGCDAVIHTAAAIGVTSGGQVSVLEQNVVGTRNVVTQALAAGCDPIVHVSTVAVFVPPDGPTITTSSRLASPRNEYGRSKVQSEHELRALQDGPDAAPIVIVYPGGVLGPDQPHLDATLEGIAGARRTGWPMCPGGVALIDVRDLADVLVATVSGGPGLGPRRLLAGGHYLTWPDLGDLTDRLLGVRARRIPFPKWALYGTASVLDRLRRIRPIAYPLTRDAAEIMVTMVPTEDGPSLESLGITLRPVTETLTDALRWLAESGHLPGASGGKLAP
jgi:nucleoside-diphosphate-sugar epimerase